MITFIGNVNLDSLAELGNIMSFPKKLFFAFLIAVFLLFLSGLFFFGQTIERNLGGSNKIANYFR